jgi:hypothetical protein
VPDVREHLVARSAARLDITATEAFVRVRAHAFATSRSAQDVARDVVARVLDFRDLAE